MRHSLEKFGGVLLLYTKVAPPEGDATGRFNYFDL